MGKRLLAVTISLAMALALTVAAVASGAYPARAASPSASAGGAVTAGSHSAAASGAPCNFIPSIKTCKSTDYSISISSYNFGDNSGCTYLWTIRWGDGSTPTKVTQTAPPDGYNLLARHKYKVTGVYTIKDDGQVTAGTCTVGNGRHTFTLLNPLPPKPKSIKEWPWAGYAFYPDSGHVTSVQATWKVPKVNCTKENPTARTAVWVGTWGTGDSSWLPQVGTDSECKAGYLAVYQLPHSPDSSWLTWISGIQYWSLGPAVVPKFPVHPGDVITASVTYTGKILIGNQQFQIAIKNRSTGQKWSHTLFTVLPASLDKVARAGGAIVEDDPGGLAEFNPGEGHQLKITGLHLTYDVNPASWTALPYRMALNGHYLVEPISSLAPGDSFTVTWKKTM